MNALYIVLFAAGAVVGYVYAAISVSEPDTVVMLRKALAESVGQSSERFEEMQVMNDDLDALEKERDGLRGAVNNLGQVLTLHAYECPCDEDTKAALRRAHATQLTNHGVSA